VPPYMMQSDDNPEGPLTKKEAAKMTASLTADQDSFYDHFVTEFFSADGQLKVTEAQRQEALSLCAQADKKAALDCLTAFGTTDFRDDLKKVSVPSLDLHGGSDATVPFEGSGQRTHTANADSRLHVIAGAPHGCNISHQAEWNPRY
jgi:pimeloyl-ACP methyl ester carboxylesterase